MVERPPRPKILLVEDERNVATTLAERLDAEGFEVVWASSAEAAALETQRGRFDLALLDVGLPDGSGYEVAERIRDTSRSTAIVFLTAFGDPEHRVRGLEAGAEDYVVKPFHFKELLLRARNALRRARYLAGLEGTGRDVLRIGRAIVRFPRFEAEVDGRATRLSHKECELLRFLVDRKGKPVSRDEIFAHVWSDDEYPTPRTIDNFVLRLRRVVENDPENPAVITSVRGVGYRLEETHVG